MYKYIYIPVVFYMHKRADITKHEMVIIIRWVQNLPEKWLHKVR